MNFWDIPTLGGYSASKNATAAQKSQNALTDQMAASYGQFMPGVLSTLSNTVANPSSPAQQGQVASQYAQSARDFANAGQALQKAFAQRGLGESSFMGSALTALSKGYGDTRAQIQQASLADQEARRVQALQLLASLLSPTGSTAANSYGAMANNYGQQAMTALNSLASLGGAAGRMAGAGGAM